MHISITFWQEMISPLSKVWMQERRQKATCKQTSLGTYTNELTCKSIRPTTLLFTVNSHWHLILPFYDAGSSYCKMYLQRDSYRERKGGQIMKCPLWYCNINSTIFVFMMCVIMRRICVVKSWWMLWHFDKISVVDAPGPWHILE